jgi:hypothetical protein
LITDPDVLVEIVLKAWVWLDCRMILTSLLLVIKRSMICWKFCFFITRGAITW